jgi:hypothetical protein
MSMRMVANKQWEAEGMRLGLTLIVFSRIMRGLIKCEQGAATSAKAGRMEFGRSIYFHARFDFDRLSNKVKLTL